MSYLTDGQKLDDPSMSEAIVGSRHIRHATFGLARFARFVVEIHEIGWLNVNRPLYELPPDSKSVTNHVFTTDELAI